MNFRAMTAFATLAMLTLGASAASASDTFSVLKDTSLIKFESEAPLENITGISTAPTGSLTVDLTRPGSVKGRIALPVETLRTGNTTRDGHMQSDKWLDAAANPTISFEIVSVKLKDEAPLTGGSSLKGSATGRLTIKGKTETVTVPIKVQYIESNEMLRKALIKGDVLRILSRFTVTLADFGVVAPDHIAGVKISDEVTIRVAVTAVKR